MKLLNSENAAGHYKNARLYLIIVILFSAFNVALLLNHHPRFFIISTVLPYMAVFFSMVMAGSFTEVLGLVVAAAYLIGLTACWLLSKERPKWLVAGCGLYLLDLIPVVIIYLGTGEAMFLLCGIVHLLIGALLVMGAVAGLRE